MEISLAKALSIIKISSGQSSDDEEKHLVMTMRVRERERKGGKNSKKATTKK